MNTQTNQYILAFLKGFLSVYDLTGQTFIDMPYFPNGFERDRIMLRGDWMKVGSDIKKAMNQVAYER